MLLLHIGTEKTGTSTLQSWFAANRSCLAERGVYYPTSLASPAHRALAVYGRDSDLPDDGFRDAGIRTAEDHERYRADLEAALAREWEAHRDDLWVISSEHLHSRVTSVAMVARVHDFLARFFDDIEVLMHLRPQIDVAVSLATTSSQTGKRVSRERFDLVDAGDVYYDYYGLVQRWGAAFGADALTVVPFKRVSCMTTYLRERLDLTDSEFSDIVRVNESLDWRTMSLVNNLQIPPFNGDNSVNHNRRIFIDDLPKGERLQIGRALAQRLQGRFDEGNRRLIEERAELMAGDLTPDWDRYDEVSNLDLLDTEVVFREQLQYLVLRFNWELSIERCRTRLAECERGLARHNAEKAAETLVEAEQLIGRVPDERATADRRASLLARVAELRQRLPG